MATNLQTFTLHHEGAVLEGQLALPEGPGPFPAVMVMANAHGLGDHMREVAGRLAALGYVALATDMYGGGVFHAEQKGAGTSLGPLWENPGLLRARVVAWFEALRDRVEVDAQRVAAIGYCFGGQCVLELARSGANVKAVVSYHGILGTAAPATVGSVKPYVAVYTGARDPWVPRDQVDAFQDEMIAAGASWQITGFGDAWHSFTDPRGPRVAAGGMAYDPMADRISWAGTTTLLTALLME